MKSSLFKILILLFFVLKISTSQAQDPQVAKMAPYGRGYLEYLPAGYSTSTELYPCIIFLHGSGERGDGSPAALAKVTNQGPPKHIKAGNKMCFTANGKTECFIVLSPQTNDWGWQWDVIPFVKYALQTYRIDPNRVYLTGLSMGGEGAWFGASYSDNEPNYFAAIAPTSAKASTQDGCNVANKKIPVWAFHGDADTANPLYTGQRPVLGMTECSADPAPIFTVYPGANHGGAWTKAYTPDHTYHNPNLYEWFLAQKRNPSARPPVTNAGTDVKITLPINSTTLTGTAADPDGTVSSTVWAQVTGPSGAVFSNCNSLTTPVSGLKKGNYTFSLTSTDNLGNNATDVILVQVLAATTTTPPVAIAGVDISITAPTSSTSIAGSGTDADGTISTYQWTQDSGPNTATLAGAATKTLGASNLVVGVYSFTLKVTDNSGLTGSDQMTVTVLAALANVPPVANAGTDKSITLPTNSVSLTGAGTDTDGTISTYQWTQSSGPNTATLAGATTKTLGASNLVLGVYSFSLKVTDNNGSTGSDVMIVTVLAPPNVPPVANAGIDKTITLPTNSGSLTGTATDTDGTIASYQWVQSSGPSAATLSGTSTATVQVTNLIAGSYTYRFTVIDNTGSSSADEVKVTVSSPTNMPPVVNAGITQTINLPTNSINLTATANDSDGSIVLYSWKKIGGGPVTMNGTSTATLQITDAISSTYVFRVEVTDNKGAVSADTVKLNVNKPLLVDAGVDQTLTLPKNSATIQAKPTNAAAGAISYSWKQLSGASVTMSGSSTSTLKLSNALECVYVFKVDISTSNGTVATDTVKLNVTSDKGTSSARVASVSSEEEEKSQEFELSLDQNYPNPFNSVTTIPFVLDEPQHVSLKIYDVSGNEIVTLLNEDMSSGAHTVELSSASLGTSSGIKSGVYFYKLFSKNKVLTKRLILTD